MKDKWLEEFEGILIKGYGAFDVKPRLEKYLSSGEYIDQAIESEWSFYCMGKLSLLPEIELLNKEIKVLRLTMQSRGELIEQNAKLRKMIIALDNGITLNCDGLSFSNGEFYEQSIRG